MPHLPADRGRAQGRTRPHPLGLAVLFHVALMGSACIQELQRLPGPLPPLEQPEPLRDVPPPADVSTLEALVQRHSDPVWIRRPGALDGYPLPFYRKRERVTAGTVVRTGYGGRAELIWPGDASNVVLFDHGVVLVANPELDEMLVEFLTLPAPAWCANIFALTHDVSHAYRCERTYLSCTPFFKIIVFLQLN